MMDEHNILKDIMPDKGIEISLIPYLLLFSIILLLILWIRYRWIKYHSKDKATLTEKEKAYHYLTSLTEATLTQKEGLYQFSIQMQMYLEGKKDPDYLRLEEKLTPYKYHATAQTIDPQLIQEIQDYIKGLT